MAWTAGVTRTTADLITAAQWNSYLGAAGSLDYLKGEVDDAIKKDGSVAFTANQPMGTHKITGLAAPTASADAARKTDVDTVDNKLDDCSSSAPGRALDTIYQNGSKIRAVLITVDMDDDDGVTFHIASSTPPNIHVGAIKNATGAGTQTRQAVMIIVPANWYYKATSIFSPIYIDWHEWDLL